MEFDEPRPEPQEPPILMGRSAMSRMRWMQRAISPWVQRLLDLNPDAATEKPGRVAPARAGILRSRPMALAALSTASFTDRVQRVVDRTIVWHPEDVGSLEPELVDRFASSIVDRFPDYSSKYVRAQEEEQQEAPQEPAREMTLAEVRAMLGLDQGEEGGPSPSESPTGFPPGFPPDMPSFPRPPQAGQPAAPSEPAPRPSARPRIEENAPARAPQESPEPPHPSERVPRRRRATREYVSTPWSPDDPDPDALPDLSNERQERAEVERRPSEPLQIELSVPDMERAQHQAADVPPLPGPDRPIADLSAGDSSMGTAGDEGGAVGERPSPDAGVQRRLDQEMPLRERSHPQRDEEPEANDPGRTSVEAPRWDAPPPDGPEGGLREATPPEPARPGPSRQVTPPVHREEEPPTAAVPSLQREVETPPTDNSAVAPVDIVEAVTPATTNAPEWQLPEIPRRRLAPAKARRKAEPTVQRQIEQDMPVRVSPTLEEGEQATISPGDSEEFGPDAVAAQIERAERVSRRETQPVSRPEQMTPARDDAAVTPRAPFRAQDGGPESRPRGSTAVPVKPIQGSDDRDAQHVPQSTVQLSSDQEMPLRTVRHPDAAETPLVEDGEDLRPLENDVTGREESPVSPKEAPGRVAPPIRRKSTIPLQETAAEPPVVPLGTAEAQALPAQPLRDPGPASLDENVEIDRTEEQPAQTAIREEPSVPPVVVESRSPVATAQREFLDQELPLRRHAEQSETAPEAVLAEERVRPKPPVELPIENVAPADVEETGDVDNAVAQPRHPERSAVQTDVAPVADAHAGMDIPDQSRTPREICSTGAGIDEDRSNIQRRVSQEMPLHLVPAGQEVLPTETSSVDQAIEQAERIPATERLPAEAAPLQTVESAIQPGAAGEVTPAGRSATPATLATDGTPPQSIDVGRAPVKETPAAPARALDESQSQRVAVQRDVDQEIRARLQPPRAASEPVAGAPVAEVTSIQDAPGRLEPVPARPMVEPEGEAEVQGDQQLVAPDEAHDRRPMTERARAIEEHQPALGAVPHGAPQVEDWRNQEMPLRGRPHRQDDDTRGDGSGDATAEEPQRQNSPEPQTVQRTAEEPREQPVEPVEDVLASTPRPVEPTTEKAEQQAGRSEAIKSVPPLQSVSGRSEQPGAWVVQEHADQELKLRAEPPRDAPLAVEPQRVRREIAPVEPDAPTQQEPDAGGRVEALMPDEPRTVMVEPTTIQSQRETPAVQPTAQPRPNAEPAPTIAEGVRDTGGDGPAIPRTAEVPRPAAATQVEAKAEETVPAAGSASPSSTSVPPATTAEQDAPMEAATEEEAALQPPSPARLLRVEAVQEPVRNREAPVREQISQEMPLPPAAIETASEGEDVGGAAVTSVEEKGPLTESRTKESQGEPVIQRRPEEARELPRTPPTSAAPETALTETTYSAQADRAVDAEDSKRKSVRLQPVAESEPGKSVSPQPAAVHEMPLRKARQEAPENQMAAADVQPVANQPETNSGQGASQSQVATAVEDHDIDQLPVAPPSSEVHTRGAARTEPSSPETVQRSIELQAPAESVEQARAAIQEQRDQELVLRANEAPHRTGSADDEPVLLVGDGNGDLPTMAPDSLAPDTRDVRVNPRPEVAGLPNPNLAGEPTNPRREANESQAAEGPPLQASAVAPPPARESVQTLIHQDMPLRKTGDTPGGIQREEEVVTGELPGSSELHPSVEAHPISRPAGPPHAARTKSPVAQEDGAVGPRIGQEEPNAGAAARPEERSSDRVTPVARKEQAEPQLRMEPSVQRQAGQEMALRRSPVPSADRDQVVAEEAALARFEAPRQPRLQAVPPAAISSPVEAIQPQSDSDLPLRAPAQQDSLQTGSEPVEVLREVDEAPAGPGEAVERVEEPRAIERPPFALKEESRQGHPVDAGPPIQRQVAQEMPLHAVVQAPQESAELAAEPGGTTPQQPQPPRLKAVARQERRPEAASPDAAEAASVPMSQARAPEPGAPLIQRRANQELPFRQPSETKQPVTSGTPSASAVWSEERNETLPRQREESTTGEQPAEPRHPTVRRAIEHVELPQTEDRGTERPTGRGLEVLRRKPIVGRPVTARQVAAELTTRGWRFKSKAGDVALSPERAGRAVEALESGADSGRPLDTPARQIMERTLGHDFGDVRIRRAPLGSLNAAAAAKGRDIYFESGRDRFDTPQSLALLGHELTHVAQSGLARPVVQTAILPQARLQRRVDDDEAQAESVEQGLLSFFQGRPGATTAPATGPAMPLARPASPTIQRTEAEPSDMMRLSIGDSTPSPTPAPPAQAISRDSSTERISRDPSDGSTETASDESPKEAEAPDLDELAREIFPIIKRMLAIERDRLPRR